MQPNPRDPNKADTMWRNMLTSRSPFRRVRRIQSRIPSAPRCRLCGARFAGVGGVFMPLLGHRRWAKNPNYCWGCFHTIRANHGGAEIDCSLLFADVRGSTSLAERMAPKEFSALMGRFYDTAVKVLVEDDAFVDKFVGDEIIGIFVPAMAGADHGARAIETAQELMRQVGYPDQPWMPIGAGVNSGIAYVGSIGTGDDTELTAMGDAVNTTARLASAAAAGEVLVTDFAARQAGIVREGLERRRLALKGKSDVTEVLVLSAASSALSQS